MDPAEIQSWGIAIGSQENVALRFGGAIGLLFNVFMVVVAIAPIGNCVADRLEGATVAKEPPAP